jgi:hypothetical protein
MTRTANIESWVGTLVFAGIFAAATPCRALNIWEQNTVTVGLDEKWGLFGEYQPRWLDSFQDPQSTILRMTVHYRLDSEHRLGLGAGHVPQFLPTERGELRIYQQFDYFPKATSEWIPTFRGRVEQRLLEFTTGVLWRARTKAQISWMPGTLGLYAWDEIFVHINGKPGQALGGFDQNRLSVGPRAKLDWLTIEAGYLLQTVRNSRNTIRSVHGVTLTLAANFW